jgi:hypothetical protein
MKKLWQNYNLTIVLLFLFLLAWLGQTMMGWQEFVAEQQQHGQAAQVFGFDGYVWRWGQATFENWQSEFLQLLTFVVLTSFLIHKGSHESKDTDEAMQAQLTRIENQLKELQAGQREPIGNGQRTKGRSVKAS